MQPVQLSKSSTGIQGLDELTGGGLPLGGPLVRKLSEPSSKAAVMIEMGPVAAQRTMQGGLKLSPIDRQISEAGAVVSATSTLKDTYEDIRQYYRTLFTVVTEHNNKLATEIAEMLGQIQSQGVVRQCVERVLTAMARRNDVLKALPFNLAELQADLSELPAQMLGVPDEYVANEVRHASGAATRQADSLPKIELF